MTPTSHGIVMKRHHFEGVRKQALEIGRSRLLLTGLVLAIGFAGIASRLVDLTIFNSVSEPRSVKFAAALEPTTGRANILDRNGMILAASLPTVSLSVDPAKIIDIEEAVDGLESVFPKKNREEITARLRAKGRFTWLARNLTPKQHQDVNSLGIPGLAFHRGERRVYPNGRLVSHVIGITDIDGHGIAGVENHFDQSLRSSGKSLQLSIDLRAQSILREELAIAMAEFKSVGAAGLIMDVQSSEIIAMVSLPDFDPNRPAKMSNFAGFNRATKGVYEMLESFLISIKSNKKLKLIIMGDGPERRNMVDFCISNNINDKVLFLGHVQGEIKASFFSSCGILLLPSYREGFPNVVVEALSSGMVVISTKVGAVNDVIKQGKNGFLISSNPPEVGEISSIISEITNDKSRFSKICNANLLLSENFSVSKVCKEIEDYYEITITNK